MVISPQIRYIEVFDITNPLFNEQIWPVPNDFVKSRFHCTQVTQRTNSRNRQKQSKLWNFRIIYLFLWSWACGILRILQSDWFRERAVFSYLLTTVMVTNYAKRRVKLQIERAKFQKWQKMLAILFQEKTKKKLLVFPKNVEKMLA